MARLSAEDSLAAKRTTMSPPTNVDAELHSRDGLILRKNSSRFSGQLP